MPTPEEVFERMHYRDVFILCNEVQKATPDRKIVKSWILEMRKTAIEMLIRETAPVSNYGDVMTLEQFQLCVKNGGFIDWDGTGYYMTDKETETQVPCRPSDIAVGISFPSLFTHVAWFNK
ncbi:MAG: hypothetical protein KAJ73_02270 [Zetaproteobacteria bacterium]|nr:hypothetical protein [Zetaproteobacteria bacterium]